jgi:hypothetical protein
MGTALLQFFDHTAKRIPTFNKERPLESIASYVDHALGGLVGAQWTPGKEDTSQSIIPPIPTQRPEMDCALLWAVDFHVSGPSTRGI